MKKIIALSILSLCLLISCKPKQTNKSFCELNGHSYLIVECEKTKKCSICNEVSHIEVGHNFKEYNNDINYCELCGKVEGLKYTIEKTFLYIGEKTNLSLTDCSFDDFDISYNKTIIKMDSFGRIEALSKGKCNLYLTLLEDDRISIEIPIEVYGTEPRVFATYEKMDVGDITNLYFENEELDIKDFEISFEKGNILEITNDNKIKAINYGTETIRVVSRKNNLITSECKVSVVNKNSNMLLYGINDGLMKQNDMGFLTNSLNIPNTELVWQSSNNDICVVNEYGRVIAKKPGYVSISCTKKSDKSSINYYINVKGTTEVDHISRFLHTALDEYGTKENSDNTQKYGAWYPNNGQPWCAMFVSWCWHFSGLSNDILLKYQGCYTGMKWCTEKGIMHFVQDYDFNEPLLNGYSTHQQQDSYKPVSGDIVFFLSSGMSHTGIAIYSDETYLYTIEGNTSDQVDIKRWSLNDARITGYAHPEYPSYSEEREDFSWIKEQKTDGTYWYTNVAEVQKVD